MTTWQLWWLESFTNNFRYLMLFWAPSGVSPQLNNQSTFSHQPNTVSQNTGLMIKTDNSMGWGVWKKESSDNYYLFDRWYKAEDKMICYNYTPCVAKPFAFAKILCQNKENYVNLGLWPPIFLKISIASHIFSPGSSWATVLNPARRALLWNITILNLTDESFLFDRK